MSSFACEYCGTFLVDTPNGYITKCEHYPNRRMTIGEYEDHKRWLSGLKTISERKADE